MQEPHISLFLYPRVECWDYSAKLKKATFKKF